MNSMNYNLAASLIGYNEFFDELSKLEKNHSGYPPHNIIKLSDDRYQVQIAVAGFSMNELTVMVENGLLSVMGQKSSTDKSPDYVHHGISTKRFTRSFRLHEHVVVETAELSDGLLTITLAVEIPESMKPKAIPILHAGEKVLLTES